MDHKLSLKNWRKILGIALPVACLTMAVLLWGKAQKVCCLCGSVRCHAPCLIDLETGAVTELNLYFPHPTKVTELAEEQTERPGTFSFVYCGNVSGYRDTASEKAVVTIPFGEITLFPALCRDCKMQLKGGYLCRYVLADLYNMDQKTVIPIAAGTALEIRCYEITMLKTEENDDVLVTVQGTRTR